MYLFELFLSWCLWQSMAKRRLLEYRRLWKWPLPHSRTDTQTAALECICRRFESMLFAEHNEHRFKSFLVRSVAQLLIQDEGPSVSCWLSLIPGSFSLIPCSFSLFHAPSPHFMFPVSLSFHAPSLLLSSQVVAAVDIFTSQLTTYATRPKNRSVSAVRRLNKEEGSERCLQRVKIRVTV